MKTVVWNMQLKSTNWACAMGVCLETSKALPFDDASTSDNTPIVATFNLSTG